MQVEQWGIFEIALKGPAGGNPFLDVQLTADFTCGERKVHVTGFYDGEGIYRIRFCPDAPGQWKYRTWSNEARLNGKTGRVKAVAPRKGNHGPVRVANTFHFAHADGTPYRQIGTTCYVWNHQPEKLRKTTLATLKKSPFNKIRMCVFPKRYSFNMEEPALYPFEGTAPNQWDYTRFDPKFFQQLEKCIAQLRDMGIECDLILFHPYDGGHWGFDRMSATADDHYLRYVVARLASYRNIWWSMANEYDFMKEKKPADWDRFFKIVQSGDPYNRLRSIHNGFVIYDHNKPWVTHVSLQNGSATADFGRAILYRDCYNKPIVLDEVKYEGNIDQRWGNISAEEMTSAFWHGTIDGCYVGHGETYLHPKEVLWWSKGGELHGKSPARIAFLKKILETAPPEGIEPIDKWQDVHTGGKRGEYFLIYFGKQTPKQWAFSLPRYELADGMKFKVEVIDTWNMTIKPVPGEFVVVKQNMYRFVDRKKRTIKLPGKPWMALRIRRTDIKPGRQEQAKWVGTELSYLT